MDARLIPTVKIEIEQMKAAIVSHLGHEGSFFGERLEDEIEKALAKISISGIVKSCLRDAVEEALKNYFTYGEGNKAIKAAISETFKVEPNNGSQNSLGRLDDGSG